MTQLLQNALMGTALILAVVFLRRAANNRLLPEIRLVLWAMCLLRLLTPAAPSSILSLWGLPKLLSRPTQPAISPAPGGQGMPSAAVPAVPAPQETAQPSGLPLETVLLALWLTVAVILAVWYAVSWWTVRRTVARTAAVAADDPRYALLPRFARLREGNMDGAPLTFGAARPTVVLTPGLSGVELEYVLAHEGVHARRRDNLWHYAMAAALAVHWWNPAVWLMARMLRQDIELSCDRAVLRRLGPDRRADYAKTLVSMAVQPKGPAFCHTFGRKAVEERITMIMNYKKITALGLALSLLLVGSVTVGFATNPVKTLAEPTIDEFKPSEGGGWEYNPDGEYGVRIGNESGGASADSEAWEYSPEGEHTVMSEGTGDVEADTRMANISTDFTVPVGESFRRTVNTKNGFNDPHNAIKIKITETNTQYRLRILGGSGYNYVSPVTSGATDFTVYDAKGDIDYTIYVQNEGNIPFTGHITISSYYN